MSEIEGMQGVGNVGTGTILCIIIVCLYVGSDWLQLYPFSFHLSFIKMNE